MAYHVQLVIARPDGPVKVAETNLVDLPVRGEVVTVLQTAPAQPGAIAPIQEVDYVVEQVCRAGKRLNDGLTEGAVCTATLYVSLLDEEGRVIPYERGRIPGITTTPLFGFAGPYEYGPNESSTDFMNMNTSPSPTCADAVHEYNPEHDKLDWSFRANSGIVNSVDVPNVPR